MTETRGRHFRLVGYALLYGVIGAMLGFYMADRGTRWFPTMVDTLLLMLEVGLLLIIGTRIHYAFALDGIRQFYEDWYRFDPSRIQRSFHVRSFLLTFAAEAALYEKSSRLIDTITRNDNAVKFLDDRKKKGEAFKSTEEAFLESSTRQKWSFLQE